MVGLILQKECSLTYPSTVILTVQSMRGITMLLSRPPEDMNSQEFQCSQQLSFNPSGFLGYFRPYKLSSLHIAHIVHVVH